MNTVARLITLFAVAVAASVVEANTNANARLAMWLSAVKPDLPIRSANLSGTAEVAEQTSIRPSVSLFYSVQRNLPPLPFNPFPALQVFDLGDNRFAYDDRAVDYGAVASPAPCDTCNTNGSSEGFSYSGPPAYSYSSNDLWVKIGTTNATNFVLDVFNMVPGAYYGIGAKSSADTDPFNTWSLVSVFQAPSANVELAGTASAATRFYNAVNLDRYVGPSVSIVSPVAGTTVSNDLPLQIRVTDILPLLTIKVYVDGVQVGEILPGQKGVFSVPTYRFPNGQHQIWVQSGNEGVPVDTDGDGFADDVQSFEGGIGVNVKFTNDVALLNYSPLYTKAGSFTLQYGVRSPQDYTFEVFQTNGTLLHTTNGISASGSITRSWNFTDLSGNSVTNDIYVFSLSYLPHSSGLSGEAAAAATKKIIVTNCFDNGVSVGKYIISYGEYPDSTLNTGMSDMNDYLSSSINWAIYWDEDIIGANRDDYNPVKANFSSDPFKIRKATQTSDILALTNALKDAITGSWLFQGHSMGSNLIHGKDDYLTVDLSGIQVAMLLGNSGFTLGPSGWVLTYKKRLFSTMLIGCGAASIASQFPDATGTPPGVDQIANAQMKKSAFLGFKGISYPGPTKFNWIKRVHYEWLDGDAYDTPFDTPLTRANNAYPSVQAWGPTIFGYRLLGYNANESR